MARNHATLVTLLLIGTSLWAADRNVSIASVAVGAKPWQWTVFIEGTSDALAHVKCVQYILGPSFPNPYRTVCDRGTEGRAFPSSGITWGPFILSAIVTFDDENVQRLQYSLNPQEAPPITFQRKNWQPVDLTSNPNSNIFALDKDGGVSRLVTDQQGPSNIEKLFQLKGTDSGYALTANAESVFVAATSPLGCILYKYSLTTKRASRRLAAPRERCVGIATDGNAVYVTMPDRSEIRYWDSWDAPSAHSWSFAELSSIGYLVFDDIGHRLIVADASGRAYAISVPDGKKQLLASNLGAVASIATSRFHILIASGKVVLFLARSDNHGENPPAGLQSLTGGHIVGVAVDTSDKLWFADYDRSLVEGPLPLS